MWTLRLGWRVYADGVDLIVASDTRRLRIAGAGHFAVMLGGKFEANNTSSYPGNSIAGLVSSLHKSNLIIEVDSGCDVQNFDASRQNGYFDHVGLDYRRCLAALTTARVLIVGLGGTGTVILQHLVAAGIRDFVLVDGDTVHPCNLERQFIFSLSSIGQLKTAAAAEFILSREPAAKIATHSITLKNYYDLASIFEISGFIDIAAVCIDHPPHQAFDMASSALWDANIKFIHGGVMARSGFFGPFFDCSKSLHPPSSFSVWNGINPSRHGAEPSQICFAPYNTIISACMAADMIHSIIGHTQAIDYQSRTFVDFYRMTITKLTRGQVRQVDV